jgi:hypothetical protein
METASPLSSVGRWFDAVTLVVGRTVTRAVAVLPRVVGRASGLEDPSPEAVAAGVIRGVTALAPKTMGPVSGFCLDLVGAITVLALATWSVYLEVEDIDLCGGVLSSVITLAAHRGLCRPGTASLWRVAVGAAVPDRDFLRTQAEGVPRWIAGAVRREAIGYFLDDRTRALRPLHMAKALGHAWTAMGEAARLVEATRALAREHAAVEEVDIEEVGIEERGVAEDAEVIILSPPCAA